MSEERLAKVEQNLAKVEQRLANVEQNLDGMQVDITDLKHGQDDLKRHMGVLHEEVLDRIKTLAFDPGPLRRDIRTDLAELEERINRRLDPIEAAVRGRNR